MARNDLRSNSLAARRPFYPWLAAFAVSCLVGTLATDLVYWRTATATWADFSTWLVTVGFVAGCAAAVIALVEVFAIRSPVVRRPTWPYAIGHIVALVLAGFDMLVHTRDAWTSVVSWGLALSGAVVLVLIGTGWMTRQAYRIPQAEVTA